MENRKGSGIFLSVIGVATLIVAIIGATFAYFSATAASNNDAISVASTELALGWADNTDGLNTNMIPSDQDIAEFAAFDATWTSKGTFDDGTIGKGQCIDDNNNEICSVYEFYVGNPSTTTNMEVQASIIVAANEFTNLNYIIYDEADRVVVTGTFEEAGTYRVEELDQELPAYADVEVRDGALANVPFDADDPMTYKPSVDKSLESGTTDAATNVRHYTMLIWINETGSDQTEADSGKIFTAGIEFKTGGSNGGGVTGIIAVADAA